jgi:hypothetical protein
MIKVDINSRKIFSIPLNPKLDEKQFLDFYQFCERNKDWISDIYFTSRIAPFVQDAMGDIITIVEDQSSLIENALNIQKALGIPVSATFNNIQIPPTQQNLDKFIINFKKLYDAGVRTATIPHTHWLATGQIQLAFPELFIKNTILRDVRTPAEVVALAQVGFDYINLDRDLMRDRDTLLRLKEAKVWIKENMGKDIKFSLLANEGCLGSCPMMVEHFEYNNTRSEKQPSYFNDPISRVSCKKWDVEDPAVNLKTANFSPWKADWDEYIDELGIDVFKMHGREDMEKLYETMEIIDRYVAGEEVLPKGFTQWIEETNIVGKPIQLWREKIKNCKFDCWECQYCDKIHEKKTDLDYSDLVKHTVSAIALSGVPTAYNDIEGPTSPRVQTLINNLAQSITTYLEIGSYAGATGCAALKDNSLNAYFVDSWTDTDLEKFEKNIVAYKGNSNIEIINSTPLTVDMTQIKHPIQFLMYNGSTNFDDTYQTITYYYNMFASETILVINNANQHTTMAAATKALVDCDALVTFEKLLLNSANSRQEWWDGVVIMVVRK